MLGRRSRALASRTVAKYATKSTEAAGLDIPPLHCRTCAGAGTTSPDLGNRFCRACGGTGRRRGIVLDDLNAHVRALIDMCWKLGGHREYAIVRLRRWAHQLG